MNNRQDMRNRVEELLEELAAVEQQMDCDTQSHSDRGILDQAWEDLNNQIDLLQEAIEMGEDADDEFYREQEEEEEEPDWGGEEYPRSTTVQKVYFADVISQEELDRINALKDDRVVADHYESDYGVYYNAADEV